MKLPTTFPALESADPRVVFQSIRSMFGRIATANNNPDFGLTAARPTRQLVTGQSFFDTTLGIPIWYVASIPGWVDATGASV